MGPGPVLGWEKCYVLGKESARRSGASRVRITGDHPRATTTGHAFAQPCLDRPCRDGQEPPCPGPAIRCAGPLGGDPLPSARLVAGLVRDWTERGRSWSIHGSYTRGFITH
ncbi:hypothetical protein BKD26_32010 [Streptomyces sp. CB03238]|nr:hypothetical protein BKD26_32010 [Streptomyces sp. CB03238]